SVSNGSEYIIAIVSPLAVGHGLAKPGGERLKSDSSLLHRRLAFGRRSTLWLRVPTDLVAAGLLFKRGTPSPVGRMAVLRMPCCRRGTVQRPHPWECRETAEAASNASLWWRLLICVKAQAA